MHPQESPTPDDQPSGPARSFGTVARILHWSVAAMVVVQVIAGVAMTSDPLAAVADPLFILHKGLGSVLLLVVLSRVGWRLTHRPPEFPDFMPPLERRIAHRTHVALYVLLLTMAVSGYLRTVADDYPIELLDVLGIPPLVTSMPGLAAVMLVVHQFTVFALVALAAVHVGVVLKHQVVDGNPVLERMWPPVRRRDQDL